MGAVELLRNELAVPGQNGVRFDHVSHVLQGFLPQLLANHGEGLPLAITQADSTFDLRAQETILRHQLLVA